VPRTTFADENPFALGNESLEGILYEFTGKEDLKGERHRPKFNGRDRGDVGTSSLALDFARRSEKTEVPRGAENFSRGRTI